MKLLLSCVVAIALFTQSAAAVDGPQRIRVTKGQSFSFNLSSESLNTVTMMGQEIPSSLKASMKSIVHVKNTSADSTTFGIEFKKAVLAVQGMGFFQIPDTTMSIEEMSSARETVIVTPSGKVVHRDVQAVEQSADKEQAVLRQFTNRNLMRGLFVNFPDQVLKPGFEWTVTNSDTNDQGNGKVISNMTMRYTYGGPVDTLGLKCGRIKAKSEKFIISGAMKMRGQEVNLEGDGIVNASYIFELSNGIPVAIQSTSQSDQRIMVGEGMEIPTTLEIKTSIVRSPK